MIRSRAWQDSHISTEAIAVVRLAEIEHSGSFSGLGLCASVSIPPAHNVSQQPQAMHEAKFNTATEAAWGRFG